MRPAPAKTPPSREDRRIFDAGSSKTVLQALQTVTSMAASLSHRLNSIEGSFQSICGSVQELRGSFGDADEKNRTIVEGLVRYVDAKTAELDKSRRDILAAHRIALKLQEAKLCGQFPRSESVERGPTLRPPRRRSAANDSYPRRVQINAGIKTSSDIDSGSDDPLDPSLGTLRAIENLNADLPGSLRAAGPAVGPTTYSEFSVHDLATTGAPLSLANLELPAKPLDPAVANLNRHLRSAGLSPIKRAALPRPAERAAYDELREALFQKIEEADSLLTNVRRVLATYAGQDAGPPDAVRRSYALRLRALLRDLKRLDSRQAYAPDDELRLATAQLTLEDAIAGLDAPS